MMYSEFVAGTGCKDNPHNYKVFQNLEIMYVNSDMTKAEIYEYGKKLVDNSKSAAEIELERQIAETIQDWKNQIAYHEQEIEFYRHWKEQGLDLFNYKASMKYHREQIRDLKSRIHLMKSGF